jgi:hypothetical protein
MLNQEKLKQQLSYNPETGEFTYIKSRFKNNIGKVAGHPHSEGYVQISLMGKPYFAHRLAFLYMTGKWPVNQVDHKHGDKSDNRWSELREASVEQNNQNIGVRTTNASGYTGVSFNKAKGLWQANGYVQGGCKHLGLFSDPKDAAKAYQEFAKAHHGEFYRSPESAA